MRLQTCVITGAARGIGKAIARRLDGEGYNLVLADIDTEAAGRLAASLNGTGEVLVQECDVSSPSSVEGMARAARDAFGRVDGLVNNAAIMRNNYLVKTSDADWEAVLSVNLGGPFRCIRALAPTMIERRAGRIVTVASGSSAGIVGQTNYASSKAGLYGLTKTASLELAGFGITVNAVSPGFIVTELTQQLADRARVPLEQFISDAADGIPLRRAGAPEDVAGAVHFLLGPDSNFITGQIINVRGGPGPAAS